MDNEPGYGPHLSNKEKVKKKIDKEARLVLTRRDFDALRARLKQPFTPNRPLQEALAMARQTVKRA